MKTIKSSRRKHRKKSLQTYEVFLDKSEQRFIRYDTEAQTIRKKLIKWTLSKFETSALQKPSLKNEKGWLRRGRKGHNMNIWQRAYKKSTVAQ